MPLSTIDFVITAIFSVLVLVNLVGNTLVCIIVLGHKTMRTTMNILLVNLAVADMMAALALVPQYVVNLAFEHPSGATGDWLCRFVTGGGWLWFGVKESLTTLVVIAFERYFVVIHPLTGRDRLESKTLAKVLTFCWLFVLVLNVPTFWKSSYDKNSVFHCPQKWSNTALATAYAFVSYSIFGAIPLGILVYLYTRIVYCLWDRNASSLSESTDYAMIQNRKKITKMVITVTVIFGILRSPNLVMYMLSQFDPSVYKFSSTAYIVSVALVALNSTLNPFIYSLHSTRFRQHLFGLFRRSAKNRSRSAGETTPLTL